MSDTLPIYSALIEKCEKSSVEIDDYPSMKELLSLPEFNFLIVSMFFGVAGNGGFLHAVHCFGLEEAEEFDVFKHSFQDVGCLASLATVTMVREYVESQNSERIELLDERLHEKLEEYADSYYSDSWSKLGIDEDELLDNYILKYYKRS